MTAAPCIHLPNRRMQITDAVEWQGHTWMVSVGFTPDGQALEAFVKGIKTGSSMDAIMDEAEVSAGIAQAHAMVSQSAPKHCEPAPAGEAAQ